MRFEVCDSILYFCSLLRYLDKEVNKESNTAGSENASEYLTCNELEQNQCNANSTSSTVIRTLFMNTCHLRFVFIFSTNPHYLESLQHLENTPSPVFIYSFLKNKLWR